MIHNYKLYIFGSRAKKRAKKYSDIDLAIDSQELTPQRKILRTLQKIRSNFFNKILYPILTSGKILPLYFEIKIISVGLKNKNR